MEKTSISATTIDNVNCYACGERWLCGTVSDFQSGPRFKNTCCRFETWAISFMCLSEETLKAVGPFYLVSMPGEVKDPMQGNGKNLSWTQCAMFSAWTTCR